MLDLSGSDARTPLDCALAWVEVLQERMQEAGLDADPVHLEIMHAFHVVMSKGNVNIGSRNYRFTRGNAAEENQHRESVIGEGNLTIEGDVQDSTLASGSTGVCIANTLNMVEVATPFTTVSGLGLEEKRELIQMVLAGDSRFLGITTEDYLATGAYHRGRR